MEYSGDTQILQGSSATIKLSLSDPLADLTAATVTVYRLNGTKLVDSAAAAGGQFTLTAAQTAQLDNLRFEWAFTYNTQPWTANTFVEILGAYLFTLSEARNFEVKQLASTASYPDSAIEAARTRITDNFQRICNVAFVPRYALKQLETTCRETEILLPDPKASKLISLEFWNGTAWEPQDTSLYYINDTGCLTSYSCYSFPKYIRIGYSHGYSQPPQQIKLAALKVLVAELIPSNLPDRALSWNVNGSQYTLSVANGDSRFYGIPAVDTALAVYSQQVIG